MINSNTFDYPKYWDRVFKKLLSLNRNKKLNPFHMSLIFTFLEKYLLPWKISCENNATWFRFKEMQVCISNGMINYGIDNELVSENSFRQYYAMNYVI